MTLAIITLSILLAASVTLNLWQHSHFREVERIARRCKPVAWDCSIRNGIMHVDPIYEDGKMKNNPC